MELNELLDNLVNEIKQDKRYIEYFDAEKKLHEPDVAKLLQEYQNKLNEYEGLKKYEQYIDNEQIKNEIRELKKMISKNNDINYYYQKYHCLNDYLEEITKVIFGNISKELNLSSYRL